MLLYGMPGAGKTACALELAHTHEHGFEEMAWFKAPRRAATSQVSLPNSPLPWSRCYPA